MADDGYTRPARPSESPDASKPVRPAIGKCGACIVKIAPNPLEVYVSEPDDGLKTLSATASPEGGTFKWTASDPSKLTITGSGSSITLDGLDEGDVTVKVEYKHPACPGCSDYATVKVRYEVRHILLAQGIQFTNADLVSESGINYRGDEQIPTGFLSDQLSTASPFPLQFSSSSATFKSVDQGVKYTLTVTADRLELKKKLETPGKPGTKELEYWLVIYDGHSRYGRGACFGADDAPGENWENSASPTSGSSGLFRMGYRFVGVPVLDVLHHGYSTDVVSVKVVAPPKDREYKGKLQESTLKDLKHRTDKYIRRLIAAKRFKEHSEAELRGYIANLGSLDTQLRIVGDRVSMVDIGDALRASDKFWSYSSGEGPAVLLQAGWEGTVTDPLDLGATDLKCRVFCHFGCESYAHYRGILRKRKGWQKSENVDRFAYFTSDLSVSITGPFWLYYLFTYDKFNAGKPWEPSLEEARKKTNGRISTWCADWNKAHPTDRISAYEIW